MEAHLVPLAGDWSLWRDFAVRSAGFPVSGLDVFGPHESAGLSAVAADPRFQEAVIWQNRLAFATQVAKIAGIPVESGSKRRQREAVVASYWQRYCAKNDTIGFFGPLAWGRIRDTGPAVSVRTGGLIASRAVHFETWCLELLAKQIDPKLELPLTRRPELELRAQFERVQNPSVRERGVRALEQLEAARNAVAHAASERLFGALEGFDQTFTELTGHEPVRTPDLAGGGRTPLYLDCTRDLEIELGPPILNELAQSLPPLLESSRWYCGRSFELGKRIITEALGESRGQPLGPVYGPVFKALLEIPRLLQADLEELQRRWATLTTEADIETLPARSAAAFADHGPAWPTSVFHSADVQLAAPSVEAINDGHFLAVIGDFHTGANPLVQGVFAPRHPEPEQLVANIHLDVGSPLLYPIPPRHGGVAMTARNTPAFTRRDDVHVATTSVDRAPDGYRTVDIADLVADGDQCTDRSGTFHAPLINLFWVPIFVAAVRTFAPAPAAGEHAPRLTIGRTVLRRETWNIDAGAIPANLEELRGWAHGHEMPRRAFCLPPGEAKPMYIDFDSPLLARVVHRMLRRTATDDPSAKVRFTEMLPAPEDCWLEQDGARYTSELRIVAVDLTRRGAGAIHTKS